MGRKLVPEKDEDEIGFKARQKQEWGLVEWIHDACTRKPSVDVLLIESKASGISVAQSLQSIFGLASFGVQLIDPKNASKVARANSVQHIMAEGMVYAPIDKAWAQLVIEQCALFPKGKHDDLVDTVTQALRWLRDQGFIQRTEEITAEQLSMLEYRSPNSEAPLYAV